jgi:CDP-Glycerol:Poly(glycerophosphate) glycerophosphotransferase
VSALGTALALIRSKVAGRRLATELASQPAPTTPVAIYFADGAASLYQLRRWYRSLEALSVVHPTVIITSDPSTYRIVRRETTLPVTYANGAPELARVLSRHGVRVVLYPNHNALNFRVLRFAVPVHVFIGHGESAKESSVSRQLKAYDQTFVADRASIEQLRSIRGFDADGSAVVIGSPWLGFLGAPPPSWAPDDRSVVLYAPTWEGDRPTMDYSSVEQLGAAIVDAVLGSPGLRLIYRPHPWLGRVRPASAAADAALRKRIADANRGDVVDEGEYGWALEVSTVCVTDVSSVAFDARALGRPVVVTLPTSTLVPEVPEAALVGMTRMTATDAAGIRSELEQVLTVAPTVPRAATMDAFVAAIAAARQLSGDPTL